MKKQICFILAFVMLFNINILRVHAQGGDLDEYASYTVTVPAKLSPGESGLVTLSGAWASNQTIKITTDNTIILTNTQDTSATINIGINFAGIEEAGSNTGPQTITEAISVETVNVLFGTWTGVINYNVEVIEAEPDPILISFSIAGTTYQAEEGMTWLDWINSEYNTIYAYVIGEPGAENDCVYATREVIGVVKTDIIVANRNYTLSKEPPPY